MPIGLDDVHERVRRFAGAAEGLLVEEKPAGIALHYRLAPDGRAGRGVHGRPGRGARLDGQRGSMVVELRPTGATKGDALRAFMTEPKFLAARPVFVGDDLTDEHAFEAAAGLGGAGILVGPDAPARRAIVSSSVAAVAVAGKQA